MFRYLALLAAGSLPWLTACTSQLMVSKESGAPVSTDTQGVPFALPMHDFVITELGNTTTGQSAQVPTFQVSLIQRADPHRRFRVRNDPAWPSTSEFSVSHTQGGVLASVSGSSDEKLSETIQAVAEFVVAAAGAVMSLDGNERYTTQRDLQAALYKALQEELAKPVLDHAKVQALQTAIDKSKADMAAIEAEEKASQKKTTGDVATGEVTPMILTAAKRSEVAALGKSVKKDTFAIILVPVN